MKAAELSRTILLVDSHAKSERDPRELIGHMRAGDIYTHLYGRRLTSQGAAQEELQDGLRDGRKRGVLFDVGHGVDGFWFRVALPAIKQGFLPDTISTDIHKDSVMLPRATMTNVMSKFLAMGLTLEQVIERSTVNPARAIRRADLGSLEPGGVADIAVMEVRRGPVAFLDSGHGKLTSDRELRCVLTVRNGDIVWDAEGLSLTDWEDAGPYSNFK
jgi:dihydroorotase